MNWETSYLIPHGSADGEWGVCDEGGGDMVAHVVDRPSAEDDARLIAAAPELLAALSDLVEAFRYQRFNVKKDFSKLVRIEAGLKAIAKAKGGANV